MIWLMRHARPMVPDGVCYGALDLAADPQATQMAAQALANVLPRNAVLCTSPLQRCERLAQVMQGLRPDLLYKLDTRLREINFGQWEGQRWDAIPKQALSVDR